MYTYIWLGVLILSLILEAFTMELVSIWFSFGALFAIILNWCGASFVAQITTFAIISLVALLLLRKIAKNWLMKHDNTKTNLDAMVGKVLTLDKGIKSQKYGEAKLNGVVWNVTTEDESIIESGAQVEIVRFEGSKIIVKRRSK